MLCYNAAPGLWVIFRWSFEKVFTFETCVCACSRVCVCRCVCVFVSVRVHTGYIWGTASMLVSVFHLLGPLLLCCSVPQTSWPVSSRGFSHVCLHLVMILWCLSPPWFDSPVSLSVLLWFSGVCLRLAVAALGSTCWAPQDFWGLTLTSSPLHRKHVYPLSHLLSPKDFIFFIFPKHL